MTRPLRHAFSLTEVVIAIGIAAFALVTLMALIPIGMTTNRVSADELHASHLLSVLAVDLRNTDPRLNGGKSLLFGLQLPYKVAAGQTALNAVTITDDSSLPAPATGTVGLDGFENPAALGTKPAPAYQATVLYISAPGTTSHAPIQARLIVNWPALPTGAPVSSLTDTTKVKGYVETYVAYPAP